MHRFLLTRVVLCSLPVFWTACTYDDSKTGDSQDLSDSGTSADIEDSGDSGGSADIEDSGDSGGTSGGTEAVCTEPEAIACEDDIILDLSLHDDKVSNGAVETSMDGDDFVTLVDASAGGFSAASNNPWVYVKFTETGAERVDIDDYTALESMDWDLSLRRYLLRLNGGSSGPSCVGAAALVESAYADVEALPADTPFVEDGFYSDDCTLINDSSGLPGSPQVALGQWWEYPGCVATTMVPHVVRLADGRQLKLVVESYYGSGQETCNSTGRAGENSAQFTLRWRWLDQ